MLVLPSRPGESNHASCEQSTLMSPMLLLSQKTAWFARRRLCAFAHRQRRCPDDADVLTEGCRGNRQPLPIFGIERVLLDRIAQRHFQYFPCALDYATAKHNDLRIENVQKAHNA